VVAPHARVTLELHDGSQVTVESWLTDQRVVLRLVAPASRAHRVRRLAIDLGPEDRGDELTAMPWDMCRLRPGGEPRTEPMAFLGSLLAEIEDGDGAWERHEELAARALVLDGVAAAVARAEPQAWRLACRFRARRRYRLYRWFRSDRSGRIAQMASVCPGVLVVACDLAGHHETRELSRQLLRDIVAGKRLSVVLEAALARGGSMALVRRAGPRVRSDSVLALDPARCVLEDIPAGVNANAVWYEVASSDPCQPLARCLSPQATAVARVARRRGETVRGLVRWLDDHVRATGRQPTRQTRIERLVAECEAWHAALPAAPAREALTPETPLAPAPFVPWERAHMRVRALGSVGELIAEGQELEHCVAAHAALAVSGLAHVYALTIDGARLTVELRQHAGRWRVFDLRGAANRPPTARERELVHDWLEQALRPTVPPAAEGAHP
jgi:hypothetical protein